MRVLITGKVEKGLLGSRLDWIIENKPEVEVWGFDDLSGGYLENVNPKVNFLNINLVTDSDYINDVFDDKSLIIYFL